jgi:transposase
MAKPYSEDLRTRLVETIDAGATIPEAAEQCGVSISSVVRFLKLHRDTGSVRAAKLVVTRILRWRRMREWSGN